MQLSTLLLAGASVAALDQIPFQAPTAHNDAEELIRKIQEATPAGNHFSDAAKDAWNNLVDELNLLPKPKVPKKTPDSEWDHIVRGADIQNRWTINALGDKEREIDGHLEDFNLRVKKVDPSKLGVDTVKQYSGYLDDEKEDKHLFYWFFESRNDPKNDPVVLWLNGGPGCSSAVGALMELGPSTIGSKGEVIYNPYSWNTNASVIFLDQPVNVGYSYSGGSVSSTVAAGKDVYSLMSLFFDQFPEYASQDFFLAGESYAGHYIPSFASEILSHKKRNINLKGVAIGNGLTDPLTQYEYYRPMACGAGAWPRVLDEATCESMDAALPRCQSLVSSCYDSQSLWSCVPSALYCNNAILGPYQRTGRNPYDVRKQCKGSNLCYDNIEWVSDWLNKPEVMKALGSQVSKFDSCNFDINRSFLMHGDWNLPFHLLVPGLLEQIPVLIYAGDADFICNVLGNEAWAERLKWPGQKNYNKAEKKDLILDDKKYGYVKTSGNLTFMSIQASGHMVPFDSPKESNDFFNRWLNAEWMA